MIRPHRAFPPALLCLLVVALAPAQQPSDGLTVQYTISFPAPEHHYAQVEAMFPGVPRGSRLAARMSRSSPGRYAVHEFAKNVFDVRASDGMGKPLRVTRPNPYEWEFGGHDGTVRIAYKVFGNRVDGTYLGIDTSHAHLNMPATLMWGRDFDRGVSVRFEPPEGSGWKVATQLYPTKDPLVFTAPNLQYLMDSPAELSRFSERSFTVRNPDGKAFTIRAVVHHDADESAVDEYAAGAERIVREAAAVFGEYPEFETGTYTFLGDYLPWGGGDGMEHRNSTVVAAPVSLRGRNARGVLGTVAHEFFHAWNVERIRPKSLEPFDFEQANISGELWLAEGFTSYYGDILMMRAGLWTLPRLVGSISSALEEVVNGPGRRFRSAVEMSEWAPFADGARSADQTNESYTFISYYTYGAAIALALDFSLRDRSNGTITLDDYMRALWRAHGRPGGPQPGLVGSPYTPKDLRDRLAEVCGDRAFADSFFDSYVDGREVADYAALLARAGIVVRRRNPGGAWSGLEDAMRGDEPGRVGSLVAWGTPAFDAGLEQGDVITAVDGRPFSGDIAPRLAGGKPGDRVTIQFRRPTGALVKAVLTLGEDPSLEAIAVEAAGGKLTAEQKAFRDAWLGARAR